MSNSEDSNKVTENQRSDANRKPKKRTIERRFDFIFKSSDFEENESEDMPDIVEEKLQETLSRNNSLNQKIELLTDHNLILSSQLEKEKSEKSRFKSKLLIYQNQTSRHAYVNEFIGVVNGLGLSSDKFKEIEELVRVLADVCSVKESELKNAANTIQNLDNKVTSCQADLLQQVLQENVVDELKRKVKDMKDSNNENGALKEKVHRMDERINSLTRLLQEHTMECHKREGQLMLQVKKLQQKLNILPHNTQNENEDESITDRDHKEGVTPKTSCDDTTGLSTSDKNIQTQTNSSPIDHSPQTITKTHSRANTKTNLLDVHKEEDVFVTNSSYKYGGSYCSPNSGHYSKKKIVSWYDNELPYNGHSPGVKSMPSLHHSSSPHPSVMKSCMSTSQERAYNRDEERQVDYEGYYKYAQSPKSSKNRVRFVEEGGKCNVNEEQYFSGKSYASSKTKKKNKKTSRK